MTDLYGRVLPIPASRSSEEQRLLHGRKVFSVTVLTRNASISWHETASVSCFLEAQPASWIQQIAIQLSDHFSAPLLSNGVHGGRESFNSTVSGCL
jgi:hypothetical protein